MSDLASVAKTVEAEPDAHLPQAVMMDARPSPMHCGISVPSLYGRALAPLLPPLIAGSLMFGWRALAVLGVVLASTVLGVSLWRFVGQRGRGMQFSHAILLGGTLALLLPAELGRTGQTWYSITGAYWPLLVGAGLTLSFFYWILGGVGARLHPVAITVLLMLTLFGRESRWTSDYMTPHATLIPPHLFTGDVLSPPMSADAVPTGTELFVRKYHSGPGEAVYFEPASKLLSGYMADAWRGFTPQGEWRSLSSLLRDQLPPLEDIIVGGNPAPIGLASVIAVLVGGLILLYGGSADWRVPYWTLLSAFVCLLVLRLPVAITSSGTAWRFLAWRQQGVDWETVVAFALYQLAASPLVFIAFFLATDGASLPTSRRGRMFYSVLLGAAAAAGQLYLSTVEGPFVALVLLSLASPALDRLTRPRTLL